MKICKIILAAGCALLIGISAAGCADTGWIVKVDGNSVPAGIYLYYLYNNRGTVISNASSAASSTSSASDLTNPSAALTVGSSQSSGSLTSSEIWSQTISSQPAKTWAREDALKSCKELAMAENLCKQYGISLTASEASTVSSYASTYRNYYAYLSANGIAQASYARVLAYQYYLLPNLIDYYYGQNGKEPVSDASLLDHYNSNYLDIKYILIKTYDSSNSALSGTDLETAQSNAQLVYDKLHADPSQFSTLASTYNADTSEKDYGLIFPKDTTSLDSAFLGAALNMSVGQVVKVQSDNYGYFIMYRVANNTDSSVYDDSMKKSVLQHMRKADILNILDTALGNASVSVNSNTQNKYDPENLPQS